jgi:hypothetical protein
MRRIRRRVMSPVMRPIMRRVMNYEASYETLVMKCVRGTLYASRYECFMPVVMWGVFDMFQRE